MLHRQEFAMQRQEILDRVVDAMILERGLIVSDIERHELRDAVELSYQTIFKARWASKSRHPNGAVERLLAELYVLEAADLALPN